MLKVLQAAIDANKEPWFLSVAVRSLLQVCACESMSAETDGLCILVLNIFLSSEASSEITDIIHSPCVVETVLDVSSGRATAQRLEVLHVIAGTQILR